MAWYWWVISVILGLNVLVVAMVALFLAVDWLRTRAADSEEDKGPGTAGAEEQGG
jgi:hypothetical protein